MVTENLDAEKPQGDGIESGAPGSLFASLVVSNGRVYIDFGKAISWVGLSVGSAARLAEAILECAEKAAQQSITIGGPRGH